MTESYGASSPPIMTNVADESTLGKEAMFYLWRRLILPSWYTRTAPFRSSIAYLYNQLFKALVVRSSDPHTLPEKRMSCARSSFHMSKH